MNPADPKRLDGKTSSPKPLSPNPVNEPDDHENREGWVALCEQAAVEQDPRRLLELVKQINHLLDARKQGLSKGMNQASPARTQPTDGKADGKTYDAE
jgi:hypothetical protein